MSVKKTIPRIKPWIGKEPSMLFPSIFNILSDVRAPSDNKILLLNLFQLMSNTFNLSKPLNHRALCYFRTKLIN